MRKRLAIGSEDLVGRGHTALEIKAVSHQLSAVSFLLEGFALAGNKVLIRQIVAFSRGGR
jgi:hypothetical protein